MSADNSTALVSNRSLGFGFFAGGFAFALEGFVAYVISSRACFIGGGSLGPFSPTGVRWLIAGITAALFALAFLGGSSSYRNWRRLSGNRDPAHAEGEGAREFIALCGIFMSAILSVGIIWCSLTLIFADVCMREH